MKHVEWKSLLSMGVAFWSVLCFTDLLGDSSWKKHSGHVADVLQGFRKDGGQFGEISGDEGKTSSDWSGVYWNLSAFVCSLIFCTIIRSMSWILWKVFKIYNVFRSRKVVEKKSSDTEIACETPPVVGKTKVLFKNQMFKEKRLENAIDLSALSKQLEEIQKEKAELGLQLSIAQKENLTARQQIEEFKLETFMMKEKLQRTANTLKENLKYKDFVSAKEDAMTRKANSLEIHLKEISKDRDILRNKLNILEKNYNKLEDRLREYEQEGDGSNSNEQVPEKDNDETRVNDDEDVPEPDVDMCKFQEKIMKLQRSIGNFDTKKTSNRFEANSKISVDLDNSSVDTSDLQGDAKMMMGEIIRKPDINLVKQNILNYNAYKVQMMKPKVKINVRGKENAICRTSDSGSSSDENNVPQRIISSTVEFQNFLKNLNTNSASGINFQRNVF